MQTIEQAAGRREGQPTCQAGPPQAERLRRIVLGVTRLLNQMDRFESACCGVTVGQCLTLTTLADLGEVTSQQLGQTLGLAPSTVTRAIAPLHEKGWIRRRRDEADRRQVCLSLTEAGAVLAERLAERASATYGLILEQVPPEAREDTLAVFEQLLDACRDAQAICCPAEFLPPGAASAPTETNDV